MLQIPQKHYSADVEIPLTISAETLIRSICVSYGLTAGPRPNLICENPFALIMGDRTLEDLGVRNGSILKYLD